MQLDRSIASLPEMLIFGEQLGRILKGGEIFELVGDVGTGKTTFVKGLAKGLAITDVVQSPTFTINRIYEARDNLTLFHYDFYRLHEPGLMREELAESLGDQKAIIALEWDETVQDLLPSEHTVRLELRYTSESGRHATMQIPMTLDYIAQAAKEST